MLWESAGAFFPRDNSLVSDRKSHNLDFFGLAVRCLLFNPEGPGSNPCLCANFFLQNFRSRRFSLFSTIWDPPPPFQLTFENFLMSPKGPPFIFLIFCNRTNFTKFKRVSFGFFGTMRLLKIRIFFENFSKSPNGSPSIFLKYRKRMDVKKSQRTPLPQFSALWDFSKVIIFVLKLGFLRPSTLYPIFFSKTGVFHMRLFQFFFIEVPPQFLPKMKGFATLKDSSRFSALCDFKKIAGNLQKNFRKYFGKISGNFWKKFKKIFPSIFCLFLTFSVEEDGFFAVFSWGRMVFETYAHPFGYFLAL